MLQGTLYCLLALVEAVMVLALLSGYLFIRLHHFTHRAKHALSRFGAAAEAEPHLARLDIVQYLVREIERTSARIRSAGHASDVAFWLSLRLAVLQLEKECSLHDDRSEIFWRSLVGRIERSVRKCGLAPLRQTPKEKGNDDTGLAEVAERQKHTITFLKAHVHDMLHKAGQQQEMGPVVDQAFDRLDHTNHELEQCVAVLEDENKFLRNQVSGLLEKGSTGYRTSA